MKSVLLPSLMGLCLLLSTLSRAEEGAAETDAFLARFAEAFVQVGTVVSEFEQDRHMALLSDPLRSSGVIVFEKPNRLRWDTVSPYQSMLIADGKDVVQFEKMGESWKKLKIGYAAAMGEVMESLSMVWGGDLSGQKDHYRLAAKETPAPVLTLTPRDAGMRKVISAVELHFKSDLSAATRVVLKEPGGDFTAIRFVTQHINTPLPAACFDLNQPAGLDEVRQVAFGGEHDE
ncbi:MAG: outer membrane lipoprotein carrier protein LolA [Verrucomicrobia bacterium]|nr:outer membrane lipoprotein carrier protein LolA [Verrucomicrobiota bacterium]